MIEIGQQQTVTVIQSQDRRYYIQDPVWGEIPLVDAPTSLPSDNRLQVFIYQTESGLVATEQLPLVQAGECATLEVEAINEMGAFLDWGMKKQLLLPFSEQHNPVLIGEKCVVYVDVDPTTHRLVATSYIERHLPETSVYYRAQQAVSLRVLKATQLGYKVIVDDSVIGLLFHSDVLFPIHYGQQIKGFIKQVRSDGKLDLCMQLVSRQALDKLSQTILSWLIEQGGTGTLTDKSTPTAIAKQFGVSKSSYKKALGKLYKQRRIEISDDCIRLVNNDGD